MRHQISRPVRVSILKGIAAHQLELVHQQLFTHGAHQAVLSTVAQYTDGIDPVIRAQQWSSFVAAYEVLRDLDGGHYDTAPVLAYANVESPDPLDVWDRTRVWDEAGNAMADALDRLFAGHRIMAVSA